MHMSVLRSNLVALVVFVAACGGHKDEGPPCGVIVDHINELTKTIPGHENVNGDPRMGTDRKQMIGLCEKRQYSAETKACILDSKDTDALAICLHKHRGDPDPNAPPKPKPIGGNSPGTMPAAPAAGSN
ncbi:MAG TPA: hypothetical protein VGO00_14510 [Kofleriaceae bacterium]|nr:hypothetical protein [Kofleriaceae bacterium]